MVWRPADGNETSAAYLVAMNAHCPSVMCFSRQNLPQLETSSIEKAAKGGYVVKEAAEGKKADLTFLDRLRGRDRTRGGQPSREGGQDRSCRLPPVLRSL